MIGPMKSDPFTLGGELLAPAQEADYRTERVPESVRHVRLLLRCALVVNVLFYLSDLHFYGDPHFAAAIAARTVIVAASVAGLALIGKIADFRHFQLLCLAWTGPVIAASATLVGPHTDAALFITFVLPTVFYLALPISFGWTLLSGLTCSVALLAAYMASARLTETSLGLVLGMLTINLVLTLVLIRSNRLRRLEWSATRAGRTANKELFQHREMLRSILNAVPTPLLIMAQGSHHLIQVNDAARRYFGEEALRDKLMIENYLDGPDLATLTEMLKSTGHASEIETSLRFPDGNRRDVLLEATAAEVGESNVIVAVVVDITHRKEMEAHLKRLATTDPLTGLANRTSFFTAAAAEIKRTQRHGRSLAVVMIDIDFFKRINDTYGHDAGDTALQAFAGLCQSLVREEDVVARLGGEEFGLLLPETDGTEAFILAERLRSAVEDLRMGHLKVAMSVSIGLAKVLPGETTVDAALSRADQALYAAKRSGRNRIVRHDSLLPLPEAMAPDDPLKSPLSRTHLPQENL